MRACPQSFDCKHTKWAHGHCAEMVCDNYVNKCTALHSATPPSEETKS